MKRTAQPTWSAEHDQFLLRALRHHYVNKNVQLFGSALMPPLWELADATSVLGSWRRGTRTMTISRALCREQSWAVVCEVLRHEMAHQFVDEVLRVHNEPPHGPTFQRVCHERSIDARACGLPLKATSDDSQDRIIDKVRRLLALATSHNEHEAELAMTRAHELMVKYNVSVVDAPEIEVLYLGDPAKRRSTVERYIVSVLCEFFFVEVISISVVLPNQMKTGNVFEVMGTRPNLMMAEYVFEFLLRTVEELWIDRWTRDTSLGQRDKVPYQVGVIEGFSGKLRAQRAEMASSGDKAGATARPSRTTKDLVWTGAEPLRDFAARRYPHTRTTRIGTNDSSARGLGAQDGKGVVLSRPITSGGTGIAGHLGSRK